MKSLLGISSALAALCLFASASAFAYGGYAAIVYNTDTQTWGSSWSNDQATGNQTSDSFDRNSAETLAIESCNVNVTTANTCNVTVADVQTRPYTTKVIETWAHDGWVALAVGPSGTFGTSGCNNAATLNCHDTQADAEASALASCNAKASSNNQCAVVRSFASLDNAWDIDGVDAAATAPVPPAPASR